MDLLIKNGKIINSKESYIADVAVKDGKIISVGKDLKPEKNTKIVDATDKFVLPGAIDVHTHLEMPFGGTMSADGYFSGTRAAACGGTTTVFDFALQDFNESLVDTIKRRDKLAKDVVAVDYAFHVAVKDISGNLLKTMKDAVEYGVPTFKVFMVYDFGVSDGVFYQVLEYSKKIGARISVHAENKEVISFLTKRFLSEGKTSAWYHYMSRPEFVEAEADSRAISFAKSLDVPLYIVHLANKEGVGYVTKAKEEGYKIYAETCPHYLEFTNEVYKRVDGINFVCSPPIKGKNSQDALWAAIKRGDIDAIATDHCPFQSYEKEWGRNDFTKIPNGCAAVENMYPYMLSSANNGKITFNKAVEVCSENPAVLFGCKEKEFITAGFDADIVIYDPNKDVTVSVENMHSDYDHTIWEGIKMHGYPEQTYSRGKLVFDNGKFVGDKGWGKFVKRSIK